MGKVVSRVAYTVISEFKSFNIEQRAHKIVSQDKPKVAPKFKANLADLERVMKEHPEIIEETSKKNKELDDRLKSIFVKSSHEVDQKRNLNPERPLPTNKEFVGYFELGYKESDFITPGKVTLKQIIQFLGDYQLHPDEWTVERIALEYKLSLEDAADMVEYYKLFALQLPKSDEKNKRKLLKSEAHYDTRNFNEMLKKVKYLPEKDKNETNS
ncbi:hypothetical protein PVAND_002699 [Polypedilum vanderplanki]|uniref:NDUFAF4-like protein n=1 Tax=Polypedilum vanderplanki TaxID=319348 RepID=A0A9J6BRY6_POLVA|nr:hypothetical protein PVAND_002699 [Polypedilum vanderplanki]